MPHKHWLILFPVVLAIIYFVATIMRSVSDMDELWRKNITEAVAFSAIATGFTCFSYLFLRETSARRNFMQNGRFT